MPTPYDEIKTRRESDPEYKERLNSYARKYRENNLEKEKERQRISKAQSRNSSREAYNAYMREWREKNKDAINAKVREKRQTDENYANYLREKGRKKYASNPERHKNVRLKSVYGITLEDYRRMYAEQHGKCAICGDEKPPEGKSGLVVDHCHSKGHVRKLLCARCNTGLGKFRDDVQILAKAIDYLNNHRKE